MAASRSRFCFWFDLSLPEKRAHVYVICGLFTAQLSVYVFNKCLLNGQGIKIHGTVICNLDSTHEHLLNKKRKTRKKITPNLHNPFPLTQITIAQVFGVCTFVFEDTYVYFLADMLLTPHPLILVLTFCAP